MQTLNTGSLKWATALFFGYLYMVASWGGYSFIANLLPIHCLACIVFQRVSARLYVAYAPWVILGALAAGAVRCAAVCGWQALAVERHLSSILTRGSCWCLHP
jgi:dolichyl-diphosphooligosaccharide--protein glycosyltransferase